MNRGIRLQKRSCRSKRGRSGEMAEWLKAHAWKACVRETVPWVRIPLSPPLHCSPLYPIVRIDSKTTSSAISAASSAMLPVVTAQTVAFDRGFGGRISRGGTHGRQAQAVRRRTRNSARQIPDGDGLYLIVAGATSRNWSYRYWKDGKQRWLGLGSLTDAVRLCRS